MSLPSGYKAVEYLEATGTQYIQTDILAVPGTCLKLDFQFTVLKKARLSMFDTIGTEIDNRMWFYSHHDKSGTKAIKPRDRQGFCIDGVYQIRTTALDLERHIATLDSYNHIYGVSGLFSSDINGTIHDTHPYYPIRIFQEGVEAKLYEFKKEVEEVLTNDLIPVLDNNQTPCMYDTITGATYYNSGTGDFLYKEFDVVKKQRLLYTYENGNKVLRFLTDTNGKQRLLECV